MVKTWTVVESFIVVLASSVCLFADGPQRISIRVVDDKGNPVESATVNARYLQTILKDGKEYRVPMELAPPAKTDVNGRCNLALNNVSWSLAGLEAHRVELTTEEAMRLVDEAPKEPQERAAFENEINDRCRRFSIAYKEITALPESIVTLNLEKAVKVTGSVRVNGRPVKKALVRIYSRKTEIDHLFARSAPEAIDDEGKFSFYSIPGKLDQAQIVVERANGNYVLTLSDVRSTPTRTGLLFDFESNANDFTRQPHP